MLNLLMAVVSSMMVSVIMRVSGKYCRNNITMLLCNYVMCSALAAFFTGGELFPAAQGLTGTIALGIVGGFFYLTSFVLMQWSVKEHGVVLPTTLMKLGVIVPILVAILVFGETPKAVQIIGIVLALAAVLYMQGKEENMGKIGLMLFLLWFTTGCSSSMHKIFDGALPAMFKNQFLFYIFVSALIMCAGVCIVRRQKIGLWDLFFGLLIGIPNYFSSRFLLHSLADIPAFVAYPCYSVGSIVAVALAGWILFKEQISRRKLIALGMIVVALVLLNL